MAWLNLNSYERQEYVELRLNAPKAEKILLEFNPLKSLIRLIGTLRGKNGIVIEIL